MRLWEWIVFWWDKKRRRTYRPGDKIVVDGELRTIAKPTRKRLKVKT